MEGAAADATRYEASRAIAEAFLVGVQRLGQVAQFLRCGEVSPSSLTANAAVFRFDG